MPDGSPWRIAAASVTGTSHGASDAPCQDAHETLLTVSSGQPVLVIAVSDGAGSARAGEIGSGLAVTAICEQAAAWFAAGGTLAVMGRRVLEEWVSGVREQIAEKAAEAESEMRDYACTLLVAVVGGGHSVFAQLGDGAIVVMSTEKDWSTVFWPQHGPYVNTTYFVTDDDALDRFEFDAGPHSVSEIGIFTDGLEHLVLDHKERTAHQPFFNRMFPPLRTSVVEGRDERLSQHLAAYLMSPAVTDRTNDDVTLVLASRLIETPSIVPIEISESTNARCDANNH